MKKILLLFMIPLLFMACNKTKESKVEKDTQPKEVKETVVSKENVVADTSAIVFMVQIGAFQNPTDQFNEWDDLHRFEEDNLIKYRIGNFDSYESAKKFKRNILSRYPDAFIQAMENGRPIAITEALD